MDKKINIKKVYTLKFLIIVVIYNKSLCGIKYLNQINSADIFVYDNSKECQEKHPNCNYFHDSNNVGVSAAYNYGIDLAKEKNYDYVILLDQDTDFNEDILKIYIETATKYGQNYIYAPIVKNKDKIYSPYIEGKIRNHCQSLNEFIHKDIYSLQGKSLINSGLMIPINLVKYIGYFNKNIKLDFSDTYFIEIYKQKQLSVVLMNVYLEHELSGDSAFDSSRELIRYKYYCNGAKEFKKTASRKLRVDIFVFFRMAKLICKYRTIVPVFIYIEYYWGNKII
ncbi:MAG TPA: hypothetical protein DCS12_04790 [Clostridiales bacterium]|nr:hypothetical protein [Clostridiales bacterium]